MQAYKIQVMPMPATLHKHTDLVAWQVIYTTASTVKEAQAQALATLPKDEVYKLVRSFAGTTTTYYEAQKASTGARSATISIQALPKICAPLIDCYFITEYERDIMRAYHKSVYKPYTGAPIAEATRTLTRYLSRVNNEARVNKSDYNYSMLLISMTYALQDYMQALMREVGAHLREARARGIEIDDATRANIADAGNLFTHHTLCTGAYIERGIIEAVIYLYDEIASLQERVQFYDAEADAEAQALARMQAQERIYLMVREAQALQREREA